MRIAFAGSPAIAEIPDCAKFRQVLRAAAPGLPSRAAADHLSADVTILREGEDYLVRAPGREEIRVSAVGAACNLLIDVVDLAIDQQPDRLWLHAGSVAFGGRLVAFPATSHAGKSTLVSALGAAGRRVFGDDILPLADGETHGIAPGIAPRLRLPLPATAPSDFHAFVADHKGAADHRYAYLALPDGGLADHGETLPLGAIVVLDRRPEGPASVRPAALADAVRALALQNQARGAAAGDILDRLFALAERLPTLALTYSRLDDAVAALDRVFAQWPPCPDHGTPADLTDALALAMIDPREAGRRGEDGDGHSSFGGDDPGERPLAAPRDGGPLRLVPAPGIVLRRAGEEAFLADGAGEAIHHLNPLGVAVFTLIGEGHGSDEIEAILGEAFPDTPRETIGADVRGLIDDLLAHDLVRMGAVRAN